MVRSNENKSEKTTVQSSGSYQIGQLIRKYRKLKGWTQDQLAEKADITKNTLIRLEKGRSWHSSTFDKVCRALDVNLEKLMQPYKLEEGEDYLRTLGSLREARDKLRCHGMPFGKVYEIPRLGEGKLNLLMLEIEPHKKTKWREHDGAEYVYALTSVGVRIGGESSETDILLREEEILTFLGTEPHQYYNPLEKTAFLLSMWVEPDFRFDKYPEWDK